MGDPVTTAIVIGAGTMQARSQIAAGKAQQNAANFNALVNERNAEIAEQQGEQIKLRSEQDILTFSKNFNRLQATTQQAFRYNGFQASSGTAMLVAMENAKEADKEIAMQRYNALVGQREASESALEQRMRADLQRSQGAAAAKAGRQAAIGTLLQTGANVAAMNKIAPSSSPSTTTSSAPFGGTGGYGAGNR